MAFGSHVLSAQASFEPYWWRAAPHEEGQRGVPPKRTDVAVVGSGITGLVAAIDLVRIDVQVESLRVLRRVQADAPQGDEVDGHQSQSGDPHQHPRTLAHDLLSMDMDAPLGVSSSKGRLPVKFLRFSATGLGIPRDDTEPAGRAGGLVPPARLRRRT